MARRIVRGSKFRLGQSVIVDGDYNGDYFGRVVETHFRLTKHTSIHNDVQTTAPGVTVLVTRWEEVDYNGSYPGLEPFEIIAHDTEVRSRY